MIQDQLAATILWGVHTADELGLSVTEFATLITIHLGGGTQADLVAATRLSPAAVSRMVERLVRRGFVSRTADPADRRRTVLATTTTWQAEIDAAVEPHRRASRAVFAEFTPAERDAIVRWMQLSAHATQQILRPDAGTDADPS